MKPSSPVPDIKRTLEGFLVLVYRQVVADEHAKAILLDDVARKLKIPEGLAEKLASFLETEGLVDYDDQAVDITIPGMLRAEAILRGEPVPAQTKVEKVAIATTVKTARRLPRPRPR